MAARLLDKLQTQLQTENKVQILILFSSKGQYLAFIYFINLPKNENVGKMLQQQQQQANQQQL